MKKIAKVIFHIYLLPVWLILLFKPRLRSFDKDKTKQIWYGSKQPKKWQKLFLIAAGILLSTFTWCLIIKVFISQRNEWKTIKSNYVSIQIPSKWKVDIKEDAPGSNMLGLSPTVRVSGLTELILKDENDGPVLTLMALYGLGGRCENVYFFEDSSEEQKNRQFDKPLIKIRSDDCLSLNPLLNHRIRYSISKQMLFLDNDNDVKYFDPNCLVETYAEFKPLFIEIDGERSNCYSLVINDNVYSNQLDNINKVIESFKILRVP